MVWEINIVEVRLSVGTVETETKFQSPTVADRFRLRRPRGGHTSPTSCRARPRRAAVRLITPRTRRSLPTLSFGLLPSASPPRSPAASSAAAAAVPPLPLPAGAHRVPPPSSPCSPLRPPPLSRAIRAVGEGLWPFFRSRLRGHVSPERSSPWSPTTKTSSSSYLGLDSSVVTSWSSYRARMRQLGLVVVSTSRRSFAVPPSPMTSSLH